MSATLSRQQILASAFFPVFAIAAPMAAAAAQCGIELEPRPGAPGTNGEVFATTSWDPDGAGPRAPVVVLGGNFSVAGTTAARSIATYDPVTGEWGAFAEGVDGTVGALGVLPNGDLVAAGSFLVAGAVSANHIARWDGAAWSAIGAGLGGGGPSHLAVCSLLTLPNGDLVAAGSFATAGGASANNIARWNGAAWSSFGAGLDAAVLAVARMPNGDLVVGGEFASAGGASASRIARWNGATWTGLGAGLATLGGFENVTALLPKANGDLVVGGRFSVVGGVTADNVARWDGASWSSLGLGTDRSVRVLAELPNGDILAGGAFSAAGGSTAPCVARWNGTSWSPLGSGLAMGMLANSYVNSFSTLSSGDILVAGFFTQAGNQGAQHLAVWNGTAWSALHDGPSGLAVHATLALPDGDLVVGGDFHLAGAVGAQNICRWDGATWSPMGIGLDGRVQALARLSNGDVVAGGSFTAAGGGGLYSLARWDGVTWSVMGSWFGQNLRDIAVLPNGDVVACGDAPNSIARWSGTSWLPMGSGLNGPVHALVMLPNGDLVASGGFSMAGPVTVNGVARWDGTAWSSLGAGPGVAMWASATLPDGSLVVGAGTSVARWNGVTWLPVGTLPGSLAALAALPDGGIVVGGDWYQGLGGSTRPLFHFDGGSWTNLDWDLATSVNSIAVLPNGDVVVGGDGAGGSALRRFATTCSASAVVSGLGCAGGGGANVLTAQSLPWIGSTCRSEATGMPATGFAFVVLGFGTMAIPLASLSPQGGPGCDLQVTLDVLDALPIVAGRVAMAIAIPDTVAFVGITVRQQVLPVEFDVVGNVIGFTATNALALTIGAF